MKKNDVFPIKKELWLVSSCLVGLKTRYDGKTKPNAKCLQFLEDKNWVPVCPEQLGGLATPRPPAMIHGGNGGDVLQGQASVLTNAGENVTKAFVAGANQVLHLSHIQDIAGMCVKARSPSCGLHAVLGVTSSLLLQRGLRLVEF